MASWEIDRRFDTPENAEIFRFLDQSGPSAHGDVAEELLLSATDCPDIRGYSPDRERYAFVILHSHDDTIVGLALGQSMLAYRLPGDRVAEALSAGAWRASELGTNWVYMEPWSDREPLLESRRRLARWCRIAASVSAAEVP